jgi:predicted phosphodiesterase
VAVFGALVVAADREPSRASLAKLAGKGAVLEVTTVTDDEAVLFEGSRSTLLADLKPDTAYEHDDVAFRTLPKPRGERLATIATVNDLHFGETECGVIDGFGLEMGPVLSVGPGEEPYPEVMNRAAVAEIAALQPDTVVAKGDLTTYGSEPEYRAFLECYRTAFGDRLIWVRGNHDGHLAPFGRQEVTLPGVTLAVLDTAVPGLASGRIDGDQLEWLDELASRADRPVLVFGHHHVWDPASRSRPDTYFGVHPDDSEKLVQVVARRPQLVGYFAGHTHRNRVRRFPATGKVPWVEVACVKDFPGTWAEYRVYEGGILQIHHRIGSAEALAWSESCRALFSGLYVSYAFGEMADRCLLV